MQHRILYDLSIGHFSLGFSGIPQDTRILFNTLSESNQLQMCGLIRPYGDSFTIKGDLSKYLTQSHFLGPFLSNTVDQRSVLEKLLPVILKFKRVLKRNGYLRNIDKQLYQLESKRFWGMIWRNYFAATIPAEQMDKLSKLTYVLSPLGNDVLYICSKRAITKNTPINTHEYDFLLTQDARNFQPTHNTTKIVRYHDAIPIVMSDTMAGLEYSSAHYYSVLNSAKNSVFVCNSTSSLEELAEISPSAAEKAYIIPYFLPKMTKQTINKKVLENICIVRRSSATKPEKKETDISIWLGNENDVPKFILSVATIEPRKNYIGLIEAWLKLRYDRGEDIKLMIVGKPGWMFEKTLTAMRPFVKSGDLMHLESVAQLELPYLYSAATCFVFPSFGEGFGLPPSEAMQCDCPVAMSDIPAHRYSAGDAALFFNPYDRDDMAHKMGILLDREKNQALLEDLIVKSRKNSLRFAKETVLPQWENLFDELNANKKR